MRSATNEYLTVTEAADLLRVSVSTIRRWIREGNLVAHRVGHRRVLLNRDDVMDSVRALDSRARSTNYNGRSAVVQPKEELLGSPDTEPEDFDLGELASLIEHSPDRPVHRRLTPVEVERAVTALNRAQEFRAKLSARYGGVTFPPSEEIIREMREERTRHLMGDDDTDLAPSL